MDISFFRTHALTRGLTHVELERLSGRLEQATYSSGDKLCIEGTTSRGLLLLREGRIKVTKRAKGGERTLVEIDAPTVLGEMELVSGESSSATVSAVTPCVAYLLSQSNFDQLVEHGDSTVSKLMRNIARVVVNRLTQTNDKLVSLLEPSQMGKFESMAGALRADWK